MSQSLDAPAKELISAFLKATKQAEPLLPPPFRTAEPGQPNPKGNKGTKGEGLSRP